MFQLPQRSLLILFPLSPSRFKPTNEAMMKIIFLLLFLSLQLSSFLRPTVARGGERSSIYSSGFMRKSYTSSARHLFEQNNFLKLENLSHGYMSNSDLEKAIKSFGHRCSGISRIYSIGNSTLGVPLWVMEISDKPGKEEAEPAFKFIGNVHGDEPVGRELLILLANWLCDNYKKDPLATLIVDNVHLHLLPSMNPDGFRLRSRRNAREVDLNRDFPEQYFPQNDDVEERQPETKAIMNWLKEIHFTASASLHGGALVANYPWDGTYNKERNYSACPDDETFRYMASLYSQAHYNMSLSKEFPGGITNGAYWYPIYGGMQDWNYIYAGCFELTLEISDDKWPPAKEIPILWEFNKMSMLNLVASLVKSGVHGRIFSSDSQKPLPGSISIRGIDYTIKARPKLADYHRLLPPGKKYEVIATMPGHKPRSACVLLGEEATMLDFVLEPGPANNVSLLGTGCLCSCCCEDESTGIKLLEYFPRPHFEFLYAVLIIVLALLCFSMRRRALVNHLRHRPSIAPKRLITV